jgi:hypothetical protein
MTLWVRMAAALPRLAVEGLWRAAAHWRTLPSDRRASPNVPLLAAATTGYAGAPEELRERYANLMAASLDVNTASRVHPAFVDFLKQMTTTEVRLVDLLPKEPKRFPSVQDIAERIGAPASAIPIALANLVRLNLVTVRENGFTEPLGFGSLRMSHDREWREIRYSILVDREIARSEDTLEGVTDIYQATALAREFYEVCSGQAWPTGRWDIEPYDPVPRPPSPAVG